MIGIGQNIEQNKIVKPEFIPAGEFGQVIFLFQKFYQFDCLFCGTHKGITRARFCPASCCPNIDDMPRIVFSKVIGSHRNGTLFRFFDGIIRYAVFVEVLLRAVGIPCRFHGFTIEKSLQKGAIPHWLFPLTPKYIIHSWVEVLFEDKWLNLEGFIIDNDFLEVIQHKFADSATNFCGYGVATKDLLNPEVEWQGKSTYIQKNGIHDDFGVFEQPDDFYQKHGTNLKGIKRLAYQYILRHLINRNVQRLRKHKRDTASPFPQSSN